MMTMGKMCGYAIFMELLMVIRLLLAISATPLRKMMLIAVHLLTKSSRNTFYTPNIALALN
jgi:hypothetical protein